MRQSTFRVWDKRNKEWITDNENIYLNSKGEVCEVSAASYYGETWLDDENISDEVEINFFTGLKDKNGKDIYEGDIVKYKAFEFVGEQFSKVIFERGSYYAGYVLNQIDHMCEVVGNIYENPELLNKN